MSDYRLYTMSELGRRSGVQKLDAENDEQAVKLASAMKLPVTSDLWDHSRFVAEIPAFADSD